MTVAERYGAIEQVFADLAIAADSEAVDALLAALDALPDEHDCVDFRDPQETVH